ncbi:DUF305 domain-containing protein [Paracoccus suum]|uniref:DUF305 domain-containing protein n=1 Tax=Paracoccus suum TaxID=2259340 RepID=A0A344PKT8_9RHOB|nr:DUF305 domain-containing protein [Paracoccus suum]AXC49993.1 DUF305 domain-containing protein [Paracoccus suum]
MKSALAVTLTALTLGASATLAQTTATPAAPEAAPMDHAAMDHSAMAEPAIPEDATPSTRAYMEAMDKMHGDMMIDYTGDADVDFVKGMIPHHQGAIDMAKIVLKDGKDAQIRKLAEEVIKAQEAEIETMKAWLAAHGH